MAPPLAVMLRPTLIAVAAVNLVTFVAFGWDKWRARRGGRRVPEAWLLGLSFASGLIGGWLAMSVFRHKTRKTSFRLKMAGVSVVNLAWPIVWLWWRGTLA